MVQQGSDLFGRIQAGSSGRLHHDTRVFQNLLFGALLQLVTHDVCSPEEAQNKNRNKDEIEEDQKLDSPHRQRTEAAIRSKRSGLFARCKGEFIAASNLPKRPANTNGLSSFMPIEYGIFRLYLSIGVVASQGNSFLFLAAWPLQLEAGPVVF